MTQTAKILLETLNAFFLELSFLIRYPRFLRFYRTDLLEILRESSLGTCLCPELRPSPNFYIYYFQKIEESQKSGTIFFFFRQSPFCKKNFPTFPQFQTLRHYYRLIIFFIFLFQIARRVKIVDMVTHQIFETPHFIS